MNQYRCENCTKEDCWYFKMRNDSRTIKDKYGELLTPRSFTWEKGCASHSDFQSERDCPVCGGGLMCHRWCIDRDCGWDSIKEVRELRQKAGD